MRHRLIPVGLTDWAAPRWIARLLSGVLELRARTIFEIFETIAPQHEALRQQLVALGTARAICRHRTAFEDSGTANPFPAARCPMGAPEKAVGVLMNGFRDQAAVDSHPLRTVAHAFFQLLADSYRSQRKVHTPRSQGLNRRHRL